MVVVPGIRILSQSYYDNSFEYIEVKDLAGEIAKKHTYYDASDKTVEIQLSQDLINSIIRDNLDSLDVEIPGGTIRDLKLDTEKQRLFVNIKYGMLRIPVSFKINVEFTEKGAGISGSDIKMGHGKVPFFLKGMIPEDALSYEIVYEDMDIPSVFTVKEFKFRPGTVRAKAEIVPGKVSDYAIEHKDELISAIEDFKQDQSDVVKIFIDKFMETDVLSDSKIRGYVDDLLLHDELVNSAVQFALAEDLDKYADLIDECSDEITAWASPLESIKYYGSLDETVTTLLYDEELKDFASWFFQEETINNYTSTAQAFYEEYKESETLASNGEYEASIENILRSDNVVEVMSWVAPREDAEKLISDAREYYDIYASTKPLLEDGDFEAVVENVIYNSSVEKLLAEFMTEEDAADLLAAADEAYEIYSVSSSLMYEGYYDDALEFLVYDESIPKFLSRFLYEDDVDESMFIAEEVYKIYLNASPFYEKEDYRLAVEEVVYSERTEEVLRHIFPEYFVDDFYALKADIDTALEKIDTGEVNNYIDRAWEEVFLNPEDNNILKLDLTGSKEYSWVVDEIKELVKLLQQKDYTGAVEYIVNSRSIEHISGRV